MPLGFSLDLGLHRSDGGIGLANFAKAFELYSGDIVFTLFIVSPRPLLIGAVRRSRSPAT